MINQEDVVTQSALCYERDTARSLAFPSLTSAETANHLLIMKYSLEAISYGLGTRNLSVCTELFVGAKVQK